MMRRAGDTRIETLFLLPLSGRGIISSGIFLIGVMDYLPDFKADDVSLGLYLALKIIF